MGFATALAWLVGGATMLGAVFGFVFRTTNEKQNGEVMGFAGGVMTAAAVLELIAPAVTERSAPGFFAALAALFAGAVFVWGMEKSAPLCRRLFGGALLKGVPASSRGQVRKALLFVLAIAVHNFPEGLAAGFASGLGDRSKAFAVALGIAIQNLPEGAVLIGPLRSAGIPERRTLAVAVSTGLVEVAGTLIGWGFAAVPAGWLPFLLAFAGGTMLWITAVEVLPEARAAAGERAAGVTFLLGFCVMLITDRFL